MRVGGNADSAIGENQSANQVVRDVLFNDIANRFLNQCLPRKSGLFVQTVSQFFTGDHGANETGPDYLGD